VLIFRISDVEKLLAMIFYAAATLFLANFALGILVQFGVVDTKPFRWLHHALFFAVFVSAGIAVAAGLWQGAWYGLALVPVLFLFILLPRIKAGTAGHAALASSALIFYVAGFVSLIWQA
jgi:isoprenylcysteine carboxyl methyltransferase (ICMT) family protein YpbQ